ncbi:hypothetical protein IFM89_016256 [Coptis chinensis]|uniref:Protein ZIP4 homolog n=1 Tax=Coptis chinensis TaxID=261450 RepID=A0A835H6Q8_9MAGN|nr:hypothetical protein IFM89_016256 [Coptis chinensis]
MNEALDLCDKGLRVAKRQDETLAIKNVKSKTLRFMAAAHLQAEEFESLLKCIKVLREGGGEQHPCLPVLAMKGWLGLGRYADAEKELRGATISAGAAVRVAHRVVGSGGKGSRVRAKVVAELVSDDRVMSLFTADEAAKERTAMHSVLWNCGADHFRLKDYETGAEIFEKSMLYVPHNVENRILRAKCFRVLCLCHLGLSHLDQAQEYINQAEQLHPNIACAFLKVYLLKYCCPLKFTHSIT